MESISKSSQVNNTLAKAIVTKAKIEQETEIKKLNHPSRGVFKTDGRKLELEPDYSVDASSHKALASYIKLANQEFDAGTNFFVCSSFLFVFCITILVGLASMNFYYFLGSQPISIGIFALMLVQYQKYYFGVRSNEVVNYLIDNKIRIEDFFVIADKNLPLKAELRNHILRIEKIYRYKLKNLE